MCSSSMKKRRSMFRCVYREPLLEGVKIIKRWQERVVGLDELHFDLERQQAWYDSEPRPGGAWAGLSLS